MSKQRRAPGELERVRRFVNTRQLAHGTERLLAPSDLADWLEQEGLAPAGVRVTRADLTRALELREALRQVLAAHNGDRVAPTQAPAAALASAVALASAAALASASRTLDAAARRAGLRLCFEEDGGASLHPEAAGVSGAFGRLLAIVHDSIAQGTWNRLKVCRDDECAWAFYDHTKNHSGAWCSMQRCGNRAKARAFRERQIATADKGAAHR